MDTNDREELFLLGMLLGITIMVAFVFLWPLSCAINFARAASWKQFEQCQNAEDALFVAFRLDMLGKWEEATKVYRSSAERWPEYRRYIDRCIEDIEKKRTSTVAVRPRPSG